MKKKYTMSNNTEQINNAIVEVDNTIVEEAPKTKTKGKGAAKKNASTSEQSVANLLEIIEELKTRVTALEETVTELKSTCSLTPPANVPEKASKASKATKSNEEKKPRAPTAYNLFMKDKMSELKEQHPEMTNIDRMKMAAEAWTESKK